MAKPWAVLAIAALFLLLPPPPGEVAPPFARARAGIAPLASGIHAPNRAWQDADFAKVARGQFDAVKMMGYHPAEVYARLRQINPRVQFVVRLDTPWNELPDPERFAALQAPRLEALLAAGFEPWVEIGNEPNLELHPQAEITFARWYEATLQALRRVVPQARYGFPGLAQDRRETNWWEADRTAIEASDWVGVHAYWNDEREMLDPRHGLRLLDLHRRFPRLPLVVTEAGNSRGGTPSSLRARQYARFIRTLDTLPYVRAVDFFILSGTADWRAFFFDDAMLAGVRDARQDPVPVLDGVAAVERAVAAALPGPAAASRAGGAPPATPTPLPTPTPVPPFRHRLFDDPYPSAAGASASTGRWLPLPLGAPPAACLRTVDSFLATHLSVRVDVPPPAAGVPLAVQLAGTDLFAAPAVAPGGAPGGVADATGFALLWDGAQWRLQYRRAGQLAADQPLAGVPALASAALAAELAGQPDQGNAAEAQPAEAALSVTYAGPSEIYQVELALEPRSAAAWVWPKGTPQPEQPNAVFAPPEAAALDGARPRYLFLPSSPVQNVVFEGATKD